MKWISEIDFKIVQRAALVLVLSLQVVVEGLVAEEKVVGLSANGSIRFQKIDHFGTSAAWWAQDIGLWPTTEREEVLDRLFSKETGIGLTLVRYNLGGGKEGSGISDPWRSAAAPRRTETGWDWSSDRAAMQMVDGAVARGASVLVFANTPPTSLTVSGKPTGRGSQTNLLPGAESRFAVYLTDVLQDLRKRWPVVAVSPINEPQWDWQPSKGQEGCFYTAEEALAVVEALVAELSRRNLPVLVSAFDSAEWSVRRNSDFIRLLADHRELWSKLTPYAVHSYWSDVFDKAELTELLEAKLPGLGTWQTEWTQMQSGRDSGMDAALTLAQVVHEDLTTGNVRSWQSWIAVSQYDYADGLLYVTPGRVGVQTTKKLWALGQWSRFVRPGAVRIAVDLDPALGLMPSAFQNLDGSEVVVVVNASGEESPPVELDLAGNLERWETSDARDLQPVALSGRTLTFPARSVTTLVARSEKN